MSWHTQTALEAGFASVPADVLAGFGERNETKVERMPASIDRKHTDTRNLLRKEKRVDEDALTSGDDDELLL